MERRKIGTLPALGLATLLMFVSGSPASADSWALPKTDHFFSADKQTRVTIVPRDLQSQLAYFDDKVEGREPAGNRQGSKQTSATGIVERQQPKGGWQLLWQRRLLNEVAPVSVLVSNDGRHVVTFDNWHSIGHGDNVVVIYGAEGELIRSLGLKDILSDRRIQELPHSVSSINWGGEHQFSREGSKLVLQVLAPSQDAYDPDAKYEAVEIDLETGAIAETTRGKTAIVPAAAGAVILVGFGALVVRRRRRQV